LLGGEWQGDSEKGYDSAHRISSGVAVCVKLPARCVSTEAVRRGIPERHLPRRSSRPSQWNTPADAEAMTRGGRAVATVHHGSSHRVQVAVSATCV
jgi:hypothetical protein